jgi:hypothetical protein
MYDQLMRRRLELLHALYQQNNGGPALLEEAASAIGRDHVDPAFEFDKSQLLQNGEIEETTNSRYQGMVGATFYEVTDEGISKLTLAWE